MSATSERVTSTTASVSRPFLSGQPQLKLVATPVAQKGFWSLVVMCAVIVVAAFTTVFTLNTIMVKNAYEIRKVNQELNDARATESTLIDEVVGASTPQGLKERAEHLGLVPAPMDQTWHVDLSQGVLLAPHEGK